MAKSRLLVKVSGNGEAFKAAVRKTFGATEAEPEVILTLPPSAPDGRGMGSAPPSTWLRVEIGQASKDSPWDDAYAALPGGAFGLRSTSQILAIEPDIEQQWYFDVPSPRGPSFAGADECRFTAQSAEKGKKIGPGRAWNMDDDHAQTTLAQSAFETSLEDKLSQVIIAHLDTGYDPAHVTLPLNLLTERACSFVEGDPDRNSAIDRIPADGALFANRGHGTATLALLAGNRLDGTSPGWTGYTGFIGGAPYAQVIPIRIADWVARFTTRSMVQGFGYAIANGAHVLSMSMGGLSSSALTDAVNLAYNSGIVLVTAAGNNFSGSPLPPPSIVFPARYQRVLAACGVMANGDAYAGLELGAMQGCYGPPSKMATALAGYTPNVPWAKIGCRNIVDMDGGGTSAATPQIAAAAGLWLAEHWEKVMAYPEPWMRVEAVRNALFRSAAKRTQTMSEAEVFEKLGQGVMKINDALEIAPLPQEQLRRLPPARASWSWLDLLIGGGVSFAATGADSARRAMLALEMTQMEQRCAEVAKALVDPDAADGRDVSAYVTAALDHGNPSAPLRQVLERYLGRPPTPVQRQDTAKPLMTPPAANWKLRETKPTKRRLRVYALDPSLAKDLDVVDINQTTLEIQWEDKLQAGPIGEYLEILDVDPASDKVYEPVDLDRPDLLAQDGHAPSEGNPEFHQQMIYAVAMKTIDHFEKALGRKILWSSRDMVSNGTRKRQWVPKLRIYPHALREQNAYYSPDKKALLFGYFTSTNSYNTATSGSLVFSCLSSDIIAHEMSHAILDGLHRHFEYPSNPDVYAFHEGFADIVALFVHYSMPDLVRFEVKRCKGTLKAQNFLGSLAPQFGESTGEMGPLRDYTGRKIAALSYETAKEAHERGSILVNSVYRAFLRVVNLRTEDLIRLATAGSGVLPEGALLPDLVNRIAEEASKAAERMLHICIRALDYCPSVDITFGDYLRALITADRDMAPDDPDHYRLALLESFRESGIIPDGCRTMSEEALAWNTLIQPKPAWLNGLKGVLDLSWDRRLERNVIQELCEQNCTEAWKFFNKQFLTENGPALMADLGLIPGVPRYDEEGNEQSGGKNRVTNFSVQSVRPTRRISPDGSYNTEVIIIIQQRQRIWIDEDDHEKGFFWFRGGATLVLDTRRDVPEIRYIVVKNGGSAQRLEKQRRFHGSSDTMALRSLYFAGSAREPFAMLHAHEVLGGSEW